MNKQFKLNFDEKPSDFTALYCDTDSVVTKEALNRLYGMNVNNTIDKLLKNKEKINIYKVKETIICDGKRKKSTTLYTHNKYLEYIKHLDDFANRGIIFYTLKQRKFVVRVKIYM